MSVEGRTTSAVKHALEAIARTKSPAAVAALIDLLPVDLTRFGTYKDREGFRRGIAAHLIDLTGESFGVNVDAWRDWQRLASRSRTQAVVAAVPTVRPRLAIQAFQGHAWDRLYCPGATRDGCRIRVWSTPPNPEGHGQRSHASERATYCHDQQRA